MEGPASKTRDSVGYGNRQTPYGRLFKTLGRLEGECSDRFMGMCVYSVATRLPTTLRPRTKEDSWYKEQHGSFLENTGCRNSFKHMQTEYKANNRLYEGKHNADDMRKEFAVLSLPVPER